MVFNEYNATKTNKITLPIRINKNVMLHTIRALYSPTTWIMKISVEHLPVICRFSNIEECCPYRRLDNSNQLLYDLNIWIKLPKPSYTFISVAISIIFQFEKSLWEYLLVLLTVAIDEKKTSIVFKSHQNAANRVIENLFKGRCCHSTTILGFLNH